MVIQDLTHSDSVVKFNIASASDRLLALLIDFLIFSPFIHLSLFALIRKIQLLFYTSPGSMELFSFFASAFILSLFSLLVVQCLFLVMWGGTPGKLILKMRIMSIADGERKPRQQITIGQALLRSTFWILQGLLFFIPFLEILSQRQRRAIHDRVAETIVVTLKNEFNNSPYPIERQFIKQLLFIFFGLALSWSFLAVGKMYRMAAKGEFKKEEMLESDLLCESIQGQKYHRVDEALALYLARVVNQDCVEKEADFSLWTIDEQDHSWANLAKSILEKQDAKLSNSYLEKVCTQTDASSSPACALAENILFKQSIAALPTAGDSLTGALMQLEELENTGEYSKINNLLEKLQHPLLSSYKILLQIKALWAQKKNDQSRGVFLASVLTLPFDEQNEIHSWMCLEEIGLSCQSVATAKACKWIQALTYNDSSNLELAWSQ